MQSANHKRLWHCCIRRSRAKLGNFLTIGAVQNELSTARVLSRAYCRVLLTDIGNSYSY